jgi:hypothetical protein
LSTHVLLAHREVYEAIEPPWFKRTAPAHRLGTGSDLYFSEQAKAAGYDLWVDCTQWVGHFEGRHCLGPVDFLGTDAVVDWQKQTVDLEKEC